MPLSAPAPRQPLHQRRVICDGFRRDDGLWDIEGRIIDVKTYDFPSRDRGGAIPAGEPVHEMVIRVTIDDDLTIHRVEAVTEFAPFTVCPEIAADFSTLAGVNLGPGIQRELRQRFGGRRGCTHLIELFGPIATTAFQTIIPLRRREQGVQERPSIIDSCHALAADGPVVRREWPQYAQPAEADIKVGVEA